MTTRRPRNASQTRADILSAVRRRFATKGYERTTLRAVAADALLLVTDQLVAEHRLGDALWTALSADWSLQQTMDIVFTVGQYVLVSTALNTFQVPLDEGLEGFPK